MESVLLSLGLTPVQALSMLGVFALVCIVFLYGIGWRSVTPTASHFRALDTSNNDKKPKKQKKKKSTSAANGKAGRDNKSVSTKQNKENTKPKEQQSSKSSKKKTKQEDAARTSGPSKQKKVSDEDYRDDGWTTLVSKKDRKQTKVQQQGTPLTPDLKDEAAPAENKPKKANKEKNDSASPRAATDDVNTTRGDKKVEDESKDSPNQKRKQDKSSKEARQTARPEPAAPPVEISRVEDVVMEEAPLGEEDGWIEVKVTLPSPPTNKKTKSPKGKPTMEGKPSGDAQVPSHEPLLETAEDVVLESAIKEAILESVPPPAMGEVLSPTSKSKSKKKKKKNNSTENVDGPEVSKAAADVTRATPPKSDNKSPETVKDKVDTKDDSEKDATPAQPTPDQGSKKSKKKQKNKNSAPSSPLMGDSPPSQTAPTPIEVDPASSPSQTAPTPIEVDPVSSPSQTAPTPIEVVPASTKADSGSKKADPAPAKDLKKGLKKPKSQAKDGKAASPPEGKQTSPSQASKKGQLSTTKKGQTSSPKPKEESSISLKTDVGAKGDGRGKASKPIEEKTTKEPAKVEQVTVTAAEVESVVDNGREDKSKDNGEDAKPVKKKKKVRRDV